MIDLSNCKRSLRLTREWYLNSGIMLPNNGLWGVAERIVLTPDNSSLQKTLESFPAWTPHLEQNYYVIEQRRADCCAQAALLFLLLHEIFGESADYERAHHILEFLFFRSGLLSRFGEEKLVGTWNWSHIRRSNTIWLDDNSWVATILLIIARHYPELDQEFELTRWGLKLTQLLVEILPLKRLGQQFPEASYFWSGDATMPHWGSLACMALAEAERICPDARYQEQTSSYHRYLLEQFDRFSVSEYGYALLGATASYISWPEDIHRRTAQVFADHLVALMDPVTGNLPSMHFEAPAGKNLCDTIYTLNWAVLGLQNMVCIDSKYREPLEKLLNLLLQIQDTSPAAPLRGCWRGMYDFDAKTWGGGDCYEGGANSIYSGWTNAPIPGAIALYCQNRALALL